MATIRSKDFGHISSGQSVTAFEMCNKDGMTVNILDFGATIQNMIVPDRDGKPVDVVLGYDDIESYENGTCFYGAIVGRYANRIGGARFILDGKEYQLEKTPGEDNHVHGIFNKKMFETYEENGTLIQRYISPDMEEGYPGNLSVEVCYTLRDDNALEITYKATTDATTVLNLTNHTYFNLNGQDGSTVFDHKVRLNSSNFTEYTETFAQSGKIIPVDNTPLDFREEHTIRERFYDDYHQLRICTGYDHNMILDGEEGELKLIGTMASEKTGICLEAYTTEPAIQFYMGNYMHLDTVKKGKNGVCYPKHGGLCFEAQHYPDSVNHDNFPSTVLRPGEIYNQKTVYRLKLNYLKV